MAQVSRGIGWSQESNLLYQILKQLNKLTSIMFGLKPKYKVYSALLTQSGEDNNLQIYSGDLIIGVTYVISDDSGNPDWTNVGAPNNNYGTQFIATATIPNSWGDETASLIYNTAAPVATVLENTIGNIWWEYSNVGNYFCFSDQLFTENKTFVLVTLGGGEVVVLVSSAVSNEQIVLSSRNPTNIAPVDIDGNLQIEIRVYL
jgi:hypothetical protein